MRKEMLAVALGAAILGAALPAGAQGARPAPAASVPASPGLDVLTGHWVRPDGGYTIVIKGVRPDGQLDAMYYNPGPMPFARAQAALEGSALRVFLELRAGGYGGSTYDLTWDPASDRLKGTYYQAVARQHYEVHFVRK
jgi:hypothetical protein